VPFAQALVDDGNQWRCRPEDVAEAAGERAVREPEQAPAGRIDDADLAVEIDDDETGGEARDDLPLSRSEASARAAIARSCDLSCVIASSSAAVSSAFSMPPSRLWRRTSRAAAANRKTANMRTAMRPPMMPVNPISV
jgi:hypothetical protein